MKIKVIALLSILMMLGSAAYAKSSLFVWVTDMYNQQSVKPQEKGSMQEFPIGSVTRDGRKYEDPSDVTSWMGPEFDPSTSTKNPVSATPDSLANGKLKFNTFCAACHGVAGDGVSKVNTKGMIAPNILVMTPGFSDGYLYGKMKFGSGAIMPPLGYATTAKERWDIVNYIRHKLEKAQ